MLKVTVVAFLVTVANGITTHTIDGPGVVELRVRSNAKTIDQVRIALENAGRELRIINNGGRIIFRDETQAKKIGEIWARNGDDIGMTRFHRYALISPDGQKWAELFINNDGQVMIEHGTGGIPGELAGLTVLAEPPEQ